MKYEDINAVRWSRLKSMRVSPLQYRYDVEHPREETVHLRIGLAIHCLVLEPRAWEHSFATFTGGKARRGKAWEAFKDRHEGKTLLTLEEYERAKAAAQAVLGDPVASPYVKDGAKEQAITWEDRETGLPCKARVDHVGGRMVELKSTHDVIPRKFSVLAERLGYHCQIAFYIDGLRANGLSMTEDPALIVCQSADPHDVVTYFVPEDVVDVGRVEYRRLLRRLKECQERDEWPGVADKAELTLTLPAWAYDSEEPEQPLTIGGHIMQF